MKEEALSKQHPGEDRKPYDTVCKINYHAEEILLQIITLYLLLLLSPVTLEHQSKFLENVKK